MLRRWKPGACIRLRIREDPASGVVAGGGVSRRLVQGAPVAGARVRLPGWARCGRGPSSMRSSRNWTSSAHRSAGAAPPDCSRLPHSQYELGERRPLANRAHGSRAAGLAMVFKLVESAQVRWQAVNGAHLVPLVRAATAGWRCGSLYGTGRRPGTSSPSRSRRHTDRAAASSTRRYLHAPASTLPRRPGPGRTAWGG
jgi:hypothetical protein